jgi:lipase (class 3)
MILTRPQEALICALASEAVYGNADACQTLLHEQGFDKFSWINLVGVFKDVCVAIAQNEDYTLLVFRGTKVPQDFMSDFACTPVRFDWVFAAAPALGEIHAGFGHTLADGLAAIKNELSLIPAKPLLITGHSLGGAVAALAGAYFTATGAGAVHAIYTFGQPRIGLHNFCNTYTQILDGKLTRFVNKSDVVPRVPFRGMDYSDEGRMIHFDTTGTPSIEAPQWQTFLARTVQSLADVLEIVVHLGVDVGDHSMAGYRERVETTQEQLVALL